MLGVLWQRLKTAAAERHYRRGLALRDAQKLDAAAASYRRTLEWQPGHARAHNNLGAVHQLQGRHAEALASYGRAVELKPGIPQPYLNLGRLHESLGNRAAAATTYRLALGSGLDPQTFRHLLDAAEGMTTERAPAAYTRAVFDEFAERFDERLVGELGYRIPEIFGERLHARHTAPGTRLDILDLGCGTGLCGVHVADITARIVGVDLSSAMLERARSRGIYHELIEGDITSYLASAPAGGFDAALAADVFIYIGDLEDVFAQVARVLRSGGVFAFSIEENMEAADYTLRASGRYAQSTAYVRQLAAQAGFTELETFAQILRGGPQEGISGRVFLLTRP